MRPRTEWSVHLLEIMEALVKTETPPLQVKPVERLAYSVHEVADMLGINYFSVYRLIQLGKLRVCRAVSRKLLVPRTEVLELLKAE